MIKLITIVFCLYIISGCVGSINLQEWNAAKAKCVNNGGIAVVEPHQRNNRITVRCKNGAMFRRVYSDYF